MQGTIVFMIIVGLLILLIKEVICGLKDGSLPLSPFDAAIKYKENKLPKGYGFRILKISIILYVLIFFVAYSVKNVSLRWSCWRNHVGSETFYPQARFRQ